MKLICPSLFEIDFIPPPVTLKLNLILNNISDRMSLRIIQKLCCHTRGHLDFRTHKAVLPLRRREDVFAFHRVTPGVYAGDINIINTIIIRRICNGRIPPPVYMIIIKQLLSMTVANSE